jgi:alpha,alpha-trehalose phosphorylase
MPAVRDQVAAALTAACATGWDELLREQRVFLDDFWDRADVEVDGDPELQQAVRFGCSTSCRPGRGPSAGRSRRRG